MSSTDLNRYYRLNPDGTTTMVANPFEALGTDNRRVAETTLDDGRWVSTVFLWIDHAFPGGRPLLFETMVFPGKDELSDQYCERYSTIDEARAGHDRIVAALREGRDPGEVKS